MTKPSSFILSTDYATTKNDANGTISITLPASVVVPGNSYVSYSNTVKFGQAGASCRVQIMSTKDSKRYPLTYVVYIYLSGATVAGDPAGYEVYVSVGRNSATDFQLLVIIRNAYNTPMSISGLSQTITASIDSFLPPFA